MPIRSFDDLLVRARHRGPKNVAIAAAQQDVVLDAAEDSEKEGLAEITLVGDEGEIRQIAEAEGVNIERLEIVHVPDPRRAARIVMEMVTERAADIAMKGKIETADFLRAALSKDLNVRQGRLLTHVAAMQIPDFDRLILITDAGVVVAPTLEQKVEIVKNAIFVGHALDVDQPKVAVLAATEIVNPNVPSTIDAASLSKMAERRQIVGGVVDGPLALDSAISAESARIKGIRSPVAGYADILLVPDIEAGNVLAKAITYFASGEMAGVVVGAKAPLIVPSRSDTRRAKLVSIALGVMIAL